VAFSEVMNLISSIGNGRVFVSKTARFMKIIHCKCTQDISLY
jgi:hypothetical protein